MTSRWLTAFCLTVMLAGLPTIRSCAQTREMQSTNCICDERTDYSNITCPLPNGKNFDIIMSKDFKYEIDCRGNVIDDIKFIPTLFQEKMLYIDYYGYKNCTMKNFSTITNKLFQNSKKFVMVEFKKIERFVPSVLEGYQVEKLGIEHCLMHHLPENLLLHLTDIEQIFINYNTKLITLPEKIFQHSTKLVSINLGLNSLISLPKNLFANLTNLKNLQLFANIISSIDEDLFQDLYNLEILELMTNQLETIAGNAFQNLRKIKEVSLRKNRFETLPDDLFRNNSNIQVIRLTDNPRLTTIPENLFANLSALNELHINFCNLTIIPENAFLGTTNLTVLNLSNNKIKHLDANLFNDNVNLVSLSLDQNMLETLGDRIFANTKNLKKLNLAHNMLQIKDATFYGLRNLLTLNLEYNSLSNLSKKSLSYFRYLKSLDMSNNHLTLLQSNTFFAEDFSILPQLENLETLNLENNDITTIFSEWSYTSPNLKEINLANNKLTYLSYNEIQFLQPGRVVLNLENNLIATINLTKAELLLKENGYNQKKRTIKLKGNPIHCDCRIYDFVRYLDKSMDPLVYSVLDLQIDYDNVPLTCESPERYKGERLSQIDSKDLTCTIDNGPKLPPNCHMQHYEYRSFGNRLILNCSNNGLIELPKIDFTHPNIGYNVQEIEVLVSGNQITAMPKPNMGYENVVELDLSHNLINEITWVPPNIQVLRLDNNNLTYLNCNELKLINQTSITNLTFHNNPWQCDCQLINFTKYLQDNFKKIPYLHNITCANTEDYRELTRINPEELCPYTTYMIIILCVTLAFVAIIVSTIIALYYRYNTQIKVWLYANNMCLYLITEEEVDQDKIYDAFISFSHEDEEFVVNELMPGLEEGPHPFKLCVHFRDFQPGEFITTNIARSIDASRRTVVVVSKGFLRSEWGKMEFRTAHTEALKEGRARVIVIVYGDIGAINDLEPEIRAYLTTNTYVKWGSPWFWDNLRYALPHSSKYARISEPVIENQPQTKPSQIPQHFDDKMDLIHEPSTPPAATTPPADSIHRSCNPLLPPTALNVSLINGSLINNPTDKLKNNNSIYDIEVEV